MDIDEPIQALLKSTGWSCEDLLEKLQNFKTKNKSENASSDKRPADTSKNEDPAGIETLRKGTDDTSDSGNIETFSDTDEEEAEVMVTNSHIISEIIEDISAAQNVKPEDKNAEEASMNETTEVTEVRVVEVNEDEEDDNFEETATQACSETYFRRSFSEEENAFAEKQQENVDENTITEITCVERVARKRPFSLETEAPANKVPRAPLIDLSSDESTHSDSATNKIEYVETFPRKKIKLESFIGDCMKSAVATNKSLDEEGSPIAENEGGENECFLTNAKDTETSNREVFSESESKDDKASEDTSTQEQAIIEVPQKDYFSTFLNFIETKSAGEENTRPIKQKKYHPLIHNSVKDMKKIKIHFVSNTKESNIKVFEKSPWKFIPNVLKYTKTISPKSATTGKSILKIKKLVPKSILKKVQVSETPQRNIPLTTENEVIPFKAASPSSIVHSIVTSEAEETAVDEELSFRESEDQLKYGEDDSPSDVGAPIENLEDIRNNLKLQLSCLRTRKKEHVLQPLTTKVVEHVECSAKLSNLFSSNREALDSRNFETKTKEGCTPQKTANTEDSQFYTQTNDLGLVILDVQGGVNLDATPSNDAGEGDKSSEQLPDPVVDDEEDAVQDGLLDQIRRIIRKQKSPRKPRELSSTNIRADSSFLQSSTPRAEAATPEKPIAEILSNDNSQPTCANDNTDGFVKKSPFVSDTLDEFLVGDSKLNISYKVPQSGAEAGLKEKFIDESPLVLKKVIDIKDKKENPKKTFSVKAKTVAQKRKLLERQQRIALRKNEKLNKSIEQVNVGAIKVEDKKEEKKITDVHVEKSYVLCEDNKLWVKTACPGKCVARIGQKKLMAHDPLTPTSRRLKKISLLDQCRKKLDIRPKYRPGPLCKKTNLQVSGKEEWTSETKCLPKIVLELSPALGRRFPDDIRSRMSRLDGNLDSNRIEFALSMLQNRKTEGGQPPVSSYGIALNYNNNQERILVRKRRAPLIFPRKSEDSCVKVEMESSDDVVSNVLRDLLTYVEIKELAPSLIMEDEEATEKQEDASVKQPSPINNNVSVFKKPQKKRSRFEIELHRLSCKVVNVEVEETPAEDNCKKPYCRLGCVCKSLKGDGAISGHCQLVECMFDCSCPLKERSYAYEHTLTLPAGTDVLSNDAVTRIEDEAKKNMAKVEREFTQTVIQTNDKTIVVGLGGRNKSRRNAKAPKKYSDYVENVETPKPKGVLETDTMNACVVSLAKLNLAEIIPYCLSHNLYDCPCRGKSNYFPVVPKRVVANTTSDHRKGLRNKCPKDYSFELPEKVNTDEEDKIPYEYVPRFTRIEERKKLLELSEKIAENRNETVRSEDSKSETASLKSHTDETIQAPVKRTARNKKKKQLDEDFIDSNELNFLPSGCSRAKEIPSKYLRRIVYNEEIFQHDFVNNLTDSDMLQARINASRKNHQLLEADLLKQQLLDSHLADKESGTSSSIASSQTIKSKRRKQVLNVRQDLVSQKAKDSPNPSRVKIRAPSAPLSPKTVEIKPVFHGEIIIDRSNVELLSKMGPKTLQDGYARLLPWKSLTESFRQGKINIWSMVDQPSRLLVNRSDKKAPKNYVDIKDSQQTTEVILWILRNKLPANYEENSVSFILKETKDNFEICGVCTKNFSVQKEDNAAKETPVEKLGITNNDRQFVHKDLKGDIQVLQVHQETFKLQELVEECASNETDTSVDKNKLYMWAALPEIYRVCKWRVIYLNSDFSYLYFTNVKYSMRYTDLLTVGKIAKARNCTVMLKNYLLQSNYEHGGFGIYFDPHYTDRVFIGPYFKPYQGFDVETLRYINKYLVSTESFNKMRGTDDYKCGHWLVERPYSNSKRKSKMEQAELVARAAKCAEPEPVQSPRSASVDDGSSEAVQESSRTTNSKGVGFTIDLTSENDDVLEEKEKRIQPRRFFRKKLVQAKEKATPSMIIMHNTDEIQIIDAPPRKPEDFNRYIFTNIPHFGYLGAYRYPSGKIDVSWPFENKLLRFPNSSIALDFLQERFSALLQPVPETFLIQLTISTEIDVTTNKPIDSNALNGHFVCGDFGFHNISTMTDEQCMECLGTSRQDILKMFARRAQVFVKKRIEHLANLLRIDKNDSGSFQIENILNSATEEIKRLTLQDRNNIVLKNELLIKKRDKAIKVFGLISELPSEKRNIESLKFRWILNKTEPIEIQDSDEDSKGGSSENNKKQVYEVRSQSPILKVLEPQECLQSVMKAKSTIDTMTESPKCIEQVASASSARDEPKSILKPLIRVSKSLYPPASPKPTVMVPKPRHLRMIAPKPVPKNYSDRGVKLAAIMGTVKASRRQRRRLEASTEEGDSGERVNFEEEGGATVEDDDAVGGIRIDEVFTLRDDFVIEVDRNSSDKISEEIVIARLADEDEPMLEKVDEPVSGVGGRITLLKNPRLTARVKTYARKSVDDNQAQRS